jgi:hypothetical protein
MRASMPATVGFHVFSTFFFLLFILLKNDIVKSSPCQYPTTSTAAKAASLPAITQSNNATTTVASAAMANRHTPTQPFKGAYQNISQGMIDTPIRNRTNVIIAPIPRLIRNQRHHNPQANLQVGFTSLSIYSSLLSLFYCALSSLIEQIVTAILPVHCKYNARSMSI